MGLFTFTKEMQKQSSRGVLWKRCSENMQQRYRRTPMPKCDFKKVFVECPELELISKDEFPTICDLATKH